MNKTIKLLLENLKAVLLLALPSTIFYLATCISMYKHTTFSKSGLLVWGVTSTGIVAAGLLIGGISLSLFKLKHSRFFYLFYTIITILSLLFINLYVTYFRAMPSPFVIGHATQHVSKLWNSIISLFSFNELLTILMAIGLILYIVRNQNHITQLVKQTSRLLLSAFIVVPLIALFLKNMALNTQFPFNDIYHLHRNKAALLYGYLPTTAADIYFIKLNKPQKTDYPGPLSNRLETTTPEKNNAHDDFKGWIPNENQKYNIILVQIESLDYEAVDFSVDGKKIMPFLNELKSKSMFFDHFFAQHTGGGSSDAELSILTGLLPFKHLSGLAMGSHSNILSLPRILSPLGYSSYGFHAYDGSFYDRIEAYQELGFKAFYDADSYTGKATGWYSQDIDFFNQTVDKMKSLEKPFLAQLITMQSHGPFLNHAGSVEDFPSIKNFNKGLDPLFSDYILSIHEVDQALESFFLHLEKADLLKNSIVILYADHSAAHRAAYTYGAVKNGELCENNSCLYFGERIPLFIYLPNYKGSIHHKIGSHTDVMPTILDLLNLNTPIQSVGNSLLGNKPGIALIQNSPMVLLYDSDKGPKTKLLSHENESIQKYYETFFNYSAYSILGN